MNSGQSHGGGHPPARRPSRSAQRQPVRSRYGYVDETETLISASDLARLGYCERKLAFDFCYGRRTSPQQRQAQARGDAQHAAFFAQSQQIAVAAAETGDKGDKGGRCFVATLALGECAETQVLRRFRDAVLKRRAWGRWLVHRYYRYSPHFCRWLERHGVVLALVRWMLRAAARALAALDTMGGVLR